MMRRGNVGCRSFDLFFHFFFGPISVGKQGVIGLYTNYIKLYIEMISFKSWFAFYVHSAGQRLLHLL
jgi:hypothetical protein